MTGSPCVREETKLGFSKKASEAPSPLGSSLELLSELSESGSALALSWASLSPSSHLASSCSNRMAVAGRMPAVPKAFTQGCTGWHALLESLLETSEQFWPVLYRGNCLFSISHSLCHWGGLAWDAFSTTKSVGSPLGHQGWWGLALLWVCLTHTARGPERNPDTCMLTVSMDKSVQSVIRLWPRSRLGQTGERGEQEN